jgi:hypothetical protein
MFGAFDVFHEGAENCARGGRAPIFDFVSGINPFCRFPLQPDAPKAGRDRATISTTVTSQPLDEYGCSGPGR